MGKCRAISVRPSKGKQPTVLHSEPYLSQWKPTSQQEHAYCTTKTTKEEGNQVQQLDPYKYVAPIALAMASVGLDSRRRHQAMTALHFTMSKLINGRIRMLKPPSTTTSGAEVSEEPLSPIRHPAGQTLSWTE